MARPSMPPPINLFEQLQQSLQAEFETSLKNHTEMLKAESEEKFQKIELEKVESEQ